MKIPCQHDQSGATLHCPYDEAMIRTSIEPAKIAGQTGNAQMDQTAIEIMALLALFAGFGLVAFVSVRMLASRGVHIENDSALIDKDKVEKPNSGD
jgi:hypothetical protein